MRVCLVVACLLAVAYGNSLRQYERELLAELIAKKTVDDLARLENGLSSLDVSSSEDSDQDSQGVDLSNLLSATNADDSNKNRGRPKSSSGGNRGGYGGGLSMGSESQPDMSDNGDGDRPSGSGEQRGPPGGSGSGEQRGPPGGSGSGEQRGPPAGGASADAAGDKRILRELAQFLRNLDAPASGEVPDSGDMSRRPPPQSDVGAGSAGVSQSGSSSGEQRGPPGGGQSGSSSGEQRGPPGGGQSGSGSGEQRGPPGGGDRRRPDDDSDASGDKRMLRELAQLLRNLDAPASGEVPDSGDMSRPPPPQSGDVDAGSAAGDQRGPPGGSQSGSSSGEQRGPPGGGQSGSGSGEQRGPPGGGDRRRPDDDSDASGDKRILRELAGYLRNLDAPASGEVPDSGDMSRRPPPQSGDVDAGSAAGDQSGPGSDDADSNDSDKMSLSELAGILKLLRWKSK